MCEVQKVAKTGSVSTDLYIDVWRTRSHCSSFGCVIPVHCNHILLSLKP